MTYAQSVLQFCQRHDWGRGAYIEDDRIQGVLESWTDRAQPGVLFSEEISLPIDLRAIRNWAGY